MGKKRHARGGRTTPKGTRPGDRHAARKLSTFVSMTISDARDICRRDTSVDEGDRWASSIMALCHADRSDPIYVTPSELLSAARHERGVAGLAIAEAMAIYGPFDTRVRARKLVDDLVAEGVEAPAWVAELKQVNVGRVWMLGDVWGDGFSLWIECTRPASGHVVGVEIDAVGGITACGFMLLDGIDLVQKEVDRDPRSWLREVDRGNAAETLHMALDERAHYFDPDDESLDADTDLAALVEHRVGLLPDGGTSLLEFPEDFDEVRELAIDQFMRRPGVAALPDADDIADSIASFAGYCDGDPTCWSPDRIRLFLAGWLPRKVVADADWFENVGPVFLEWLKFAAAERQLPADALDINLDAAELILAELVGGESSQSQSPASAIIAEMQRDGVDPLDEAAVKRWIAAYNERPRDERY